MSRKHRRQQIAAQNRPKVTVKSTAVKLPAVAVTEHRRWWAGRPGWVGRVAWAIFVWFCETVIGLIPYVAHEAAAAIVSENGNTYNSSISPEICALIMVLSGLGLLSLLRDWIRKSAVFASPLTLILFLSNLLALGCGAFMYSFASNGALTGHVANAPTWGLAAALVATLCLAAERGYMSEH
jgi:hypothetical protein